jgi:hypothetical protein
VRDNDSDNDGDYQQNWSHQEEVIAKAFRKLRCLYKNNRDEDETFEIEYKNDSKLSHFRIEVDIIK